MPSGNDTPLTREEIAWALRRLGLAAGDGVMVHSSLKSFGPVAGGPAAVIGALMDVLTAEGTLLFPSFNHGVPFAPGGEGFFDPATTPTTNGAIPETFWHMPGVLRSLAPTHSFACWGCHARRYTENHHRTLPLGPDSPLGLLAREGGYGLLLGVWYTANTFHHIVETTMNSPCLGQRTEAMPMRLGDGRIVEGRSFAWRNPNCPITDPGRYGLLMESRGLQRETQIGSCRAILFRLSDCFDVIHELLTTGLEEFPPCHQCPSRPLRGGHTVESDWDFEHNCLKPDSAAWGY